MAISELMKEKLLILKNVMIICVAFVFSFTALSSITNLQSSLNAEEGLGTTTLALVYVGLVISCLFVPSLVIGRLGCKWALTISMIGYLIYMLCNLAPSWYTLVPGSLLLGASAAPLWSSKCTYLTQISVNYAKINSEETEVVVTRFFGIFFAFFQTSQIWGNLISSTILKPDETPEEHVNDTDFNLCGMNFCPWNVDNNTHLTKPPASKVYMLMGVLITISALGLLMVLFLLDQITLTNRKKESNLQKLLGTVRQLKDARQILLIPITMYSGLEQGYITGDFTKGFVTCELGIWMVGYTMIGFGVSDSISSYLVGKLMEKINRIAIMAIGTVAHLTVFLILMAWQDPPRSFVFYIILACILGVGDAVWQTEINAIYGVMFPKNPEAAFSNYRLWESLGFVCAFGYGQFLCVDTKTYICFSVLIVSMVCYLVVELVLHKPEPENEQNGVQSGGTSIISINLAVGEKSETNF